MSAEERLLVRTLSNKPSFSLQRSPIDRKNSLQLLSNMVPGQRVARNVVVATSLVPEAATAVKWAAQHLCRKGDAVTLVHVARCLSTPAEVMDCHPTTYGIAEQHCMMRKVFHSGPGNAFAISDKHRDRRELLQAQAIIKDRLLPLVPSGVFYDVRIFADTWNAPTAEVGAAVLRVASELGAFAIVVADNDQPAWGAMRLGDVTKWLMAAAAAHKPHAIPIALVRKQPPQESPTTLRSPSAPASIDIRSHRALHMATLEEAPAAAGANSEPGQGSSLAEAAAAAVAAVNEEMAGGPTAVPTPETKPCMEDLPRSISLWQHSDSAYL